MTPVSLHCHPATTCAPVHGLTARVRYTPGRHLGLRYRVSGDIGALRLPPRQPPAPADGLWHGTCFEAFLRVPGSCGYVELNFSPSTRWAAYRFDDYRRGMHVLAPRRPPEITCRRVDDRLDMEISLHLPSLEIPASGGLELGLAAVLQDRSGVLSYWALVHPAAQPDFHHPAGFLLKLSPSGAAG